MMLGKKFLIDILYNIKFHELVCSVLHELIFVIDTLMKSEIFLKLVSLMGLSSQSFYMGRKGEGVPPLLGGGKGLGCKFEGLILFT